MLGLVAVRPRGRLAESGQVIMAPELERCFLIIFEMVVANRVIRSDEVEISFDVIEDFNDATLIKDEERLQYGSLSLSV